MASQQIHESVVELGGKSCFVTIGATAGFDSLVQAVLDEKFIRALEGHGYKELVIQHGKDEAGVYKTFMDETRTAQRPSGTLKVSGFGFNKVGLGQEMRAVKRDKDRQEGVVISHAGSGSILDALRINAPLIVVPNPHLLDNHQVELAEELAKQGYVTHGRLDDLTTSLDQFEAKRDQKNSWPPDNSKWDPEDRGIEGVMADQLGFVD